MLIQNLIKKKLINPPPWMASNIHYLCIGGSISYGVSVDQSDWDLTGVVIPPIDYIFPSDQIVGFGTKPPNFELWEKHHIEDKSAKKNYDISIHNITKYFQLCMECNPNMIDTLFVPRECVVHITEAFEVVRTNRKLFLHKGLVKKCIGYAYSQLNKSKNCLNYLQNIYKFEEQSCIPHSTTYSDTSTDRFMEKYNWKIRNSYDELWSAGLVKTKRFESQKIFGCDVKSLYNVFRLVDQAEYVLTHHDLDLQEKSRREKMKAIRRGLLTHEEVQKIFSDKERVLLKLYETSSLPMKPDETKIKNLLLTCLESHYGSIDKVYKSRDRYKECCDEIQNIMRKYIC